MRLELTRVGLLVELANHYTTRGAHYRKNRIVIEKSLSELCGFELLIEPPTQRDFYPVDEAYLP